MTNIITKSYLACYNSFAEQFKNAGIDYQGRLVLSNTDVNARKIWTHYSKPLMQIIGETNKESNNLFARQIFLTVGAETLGSPSNLEKSRKAVRAILKNNGITDSDTLEIDNGSGLSRTARANTAVFEEILEKAYSKFGNRWLNALSIAGIDGPVKRRFPSSMRNMVWMKTGTVKNAKNIIGYVRSTNGTLYTVAILINDPRASSSGYKLENEIIKMLANVSSNDFSSSSFQASEERKTVSDGKYFVQVGSFSSSHTSYLESRLKNLQYDYKIITNGVNKKILVGPYSNKDEAQKNLSELKNKINSEAFIVTL
jgi:D-alanyl-D-alanine carboxypeptidase/D-alanyl-D-alanine-endopeptidase (penicillin-binding protein 4)